MKLQISPAEYCRRLTDLQREVAANGLDLLIVTSFESIFNLTGAGFEPLERPFFLLVQPDRPPTLLVPKLDQEHMSKAVGIPRKWNHSSSRTGSLLNVVRDGCVGIPYIYRI